MKHIILSATVVAITAALLVVSSLAVTAQEGGQYATQTGPTEICAPWSKAWDLSKGQWYFEWYRWCVDPSLYDPALESSWYTEQGGTEWAGQANLCPESGSCTMSPTGGMQITRP